MAALCLTRLSAASLSELHGFPTAPSPNAGLVLGPDGALYGTTILGGDFGFGSVFRVTTNGQYTTLFSFNGTNGAEPQPDLILGTDGNLYGTAYYGNGSFQNGVAAGNGSVFRLTTNGTLATLAAFSPDFGVLPASLVRAPDGTLYGTVYKIVSNLVTTHVFRLTPDGQLTDISGPGFTNSASGLVVGDDGNVYGITPFDGDFGLGSIFRLSPSGDLSTVHSFDGTNGSYPGGNLIKGPDGSFYGAISGNLSDPSGSLYRVTADGNFSTIYANPSDSFSALIPCAVDHAGTLFGIGPGTILIGNIGPDTNLIDNGFVFFLTTNGNFNVLTAFDRTNGAFPNDALALDTNGNLFGTAGSGGQSGAGTVFKVTPTGTLAALTSFDAAAGFAPNSLVQGADGNLYGTTRSGGNGGGLGIAFKITSRGAFTHLADFSVTNGGAVAGPLGVPLVEAPDGFYGLQDTGIFRLGRDGTLTNFPFNWNDTLNNPSLLRGLDGWIYGIGAESFAKIFRFQPGGLPQVLVPTSDTNIGWPTSLLQSSNGDLFGIAPSAGLHIFSSGSNSIFKCTTNGTIAPLVTFVSTNYPFQLAMGPDGNLYGMSALDYQALPPTPVPGHAAFAQPNFANDAGIYFFRVTPAGTFSNLSFLSADSYDYPGGLLLPASNGNFYSLSPMGRLFQITTNGAVTELPFSDPSAAPTLGIPLNPSGPGIRVPLLQGADGDFYGTFSTAGSGGGGFIFHYTLRPTLLATNGTNGSLTLTWDTIPDSPYQLQSSPTLNPPVWTNVGSLITTSNFFLTNSDFPATSNRFYRVLQQP